MHFSFITGLLNEGDELLSVNGIDLTGFDVDHVSNILVGFQTIPCHILIPTINFAKKRFLLKISERKIRTSVFLTFIILSS